MENQQKDISQLDKAISDIAISAIDKYLSDQRFYDAADSIVLTIRGFENHEALLSFLIQRVNKLTNDELHEFNYQLIKCFYYARTAIDKFNETDAGRRLDYILHFLTNSILYKIQENKIYGWRTNQLKSKKDLALNDIRIKKMLKQVSELSHIGLSVNEKDHSKKRTELHEIFPFMDGGFGGFGDGIDIDSVMVSQCETLTGIFRICFKKGEKEDNMLVTRPVTKVGIPNGITVKLYKDSELLFSCTFSLNRNREKPYELVCEGGTPLLFGTKEADQDFEEVYLKEVYSCGREKAEIRMTGGKATLIFTTQME